MTDDSRVEPGSVTDSSGLRDLIGALAGGDVRDALTGLGTHASLCRFLETAASDTTRDVVSMITVDVDGLADVNRRFGHAAGDDLLCRVAGIAISSLRACATHADARAVVARTGASEIGIAARGMGRGDAALLGNAIRRAVSAVRTGDTPPSASVGIASVPDDATSALELLDAARDALRVAKCNGRNVTVLHDARIASEGRTARRAIEQLLGPAGVNALRFHYQPIVDARQGRVAACEALCRPQHHRFPGPAALFEEAARRDAVWALGRVARPIAVAPLATTTDAATLFLNVHPHELSDPALLEPPLELRSVAGSIVLEIGECARILDLEQVREALARLRAHGFRVALDDLGAGYAGLGTLAGLDLDYVKLDRCLVATVHRSESVRRLVDRLVSYAHERGIHVVAEGVETRAQHDALVEAGADLLQGWLYGRGGETIPTLGSLPCSR